MTNWEIHDDCEVKSSRCDKNKKVEPHAVVYVRFNTIDRKMPPSTMYTKSDEDNLVKREMDIEVLDDSDTTSRDNWRGKETQEVVIDNSSAVAGPIAGIIQGGGR